MSRKRVLALAVLIALGLMSVAGLYLEESRRYGAMQARFALVQERMALEEVEGILGPGGRGWLFADERGGRVVVLIRRHWRNGNDRLVVEFSPNDGRVLGKAVEQDVFSFWGDLRSLSGDRLPRLPW